MKNIILLHGALGTSNELKGLKIELEKQGHRVDGFDFSGHGFKSFEVDFGIDQFTKELDEFISSRQILKPIVFGYSMGGYVALNHAIQFSGLIDRIIVFGTKFNWTKEFVTSEIAKLDPAKLSEKAPEFVKGLIEKHGEQWKKLILKVADMMVEIGNKKEAFSYGLHKLNLPVLIGRAEKDHMVSLEESELVKGTLINGSIFQLPASKHAFETVNCPALCQIIDPFIFRMP